MKDFSRRGVVLYKSYTEKSTINLDYLKYLKFKRKILHIIYTEIIELREALYIVYTDSAIRRGGLLSCDVYRIILSRNLLSFFSG